MTGTGSQRRGAAVTLLVLRRLGIAWGLVLYLLLPTAAVSWLIAPQLTELGVFAAAVAALGSLIHQNWRTGAWQAGLFAVLGMLAALASASPVLGGVLMGLCGLGLGLSGLRGWHYSLFLPPILLASVLINPVPSTAVAVTQRALVTENTGIAVSAFLVMLAGGALAVLLCLPLVHRMNRKHPPRALPRLSARSAWFSGIVLAVVLGIATWWVLADERVPDASWLLLTLVLLLQPSAKLSTTKAIVRAGGTLVGSVIAVVIALIPWHPAVVVITIVLTAAASVAVFDTAKRYWLWVVLWTPSIVLLTSQSTNIIRATEFRLGGTVVAALISVGIVLLVQLLRPRERDAAGGKAVGEAVS